MANLIKNRQAAPDSWQKLDASAGGDLNVPETGDVLVPLAVWRVHRSMLLARGGRVGVLLNGHDEPDTIVDDLGHLSLVAIHFAKFTDGRGYSLARLLRERHGWKGELRATGDIQRDQIYYLSRCGFDAFELKEGADLASALAAFNDFSEAYQSSVDRPIPLFRRRAAGNRNLHGR
jgi:uncharacterized protein (DUF934 family)